MTPELWEQVERIFNEVLNRAPAERAAYLQAVCANDSMLRKNVESLLAAHEEASGFIERPAMEIAAESIAVQATLSPGKILTHFRVLSRLGRGGMGVVYLAEDIRLGRKVALKLLPPEFAQDKERLWRFEQEAFATSALNHPNIVTVHEISESETGHAIVMELIEGHTLSTPAEEPLPLESLVHWGKQIAGALAAAHAAGIIHRDIKPENIMVRDDGYVKVLDFGLARLTRGKQTAFGVAALALTGQGMVAGTLQYMSPEQARGEPVSSPTDIFSLGIIFYQLATGKHPFPVKAVTEVDASNSTINLPLAVLHAIISQTPTPPSRLNPKLPAALETLILQMLEKDASRRPTAVEVGKLLTDSVGRSKELEKYRKRTLLVAWAPIAALLLIGGFIYYRHVRSERPPVTFKAVPLTSETGYEHHPSFSPDGTQVAYSSDRNTGVNDDILVRLVLGGVPVRLTTNPANDLAPAWSPDGRSIAFVRLTDKTQMDLLLTTPAPESEQKLATFRFKRLNATPRVTWTPDSQYLVVPEASGREASSALYLFSVVTREKRRLTDPPAGTNGDHSPALSPDGRTLAFIRSGGGDETHLFVLALTSEYEPLGGLRQLASEHRSPMDPAWTADGREVVFAAATATDAASLWRVSASGSAPATLIEIAGGSGRQPAISIKGNRLAFRATTFDFDIGRVDISPRSDVTNLPQLVASTRADVFPQYSPDGSRIALVSSRSGAAEIWLYNADGSNALQRTFFKAHATEPFWFPNGQRIVFTSNKDGQYDLYTIDAGGGGSPRRLTSHPAHDVFPSVSRDGSFVYFASNRSGRSEIWRIPVEGGEEATQLTKGGGVYAVESSDGKCVFYKKAEGDSNLWKLTVERGTEMTSVGPVRGNNFAVTQDGIYFIAPGRRGTLLLQFYAFATGNISKIMQLENANHVGISARRDGRSILYSRRTQGDSDIMVVENFR